MTDFKRPPFGLTTALVEAAAEMRGVDPLRIMRRDRTRDVSHARFGVIWALRSLSYGTVEIAKAVGLGDHSSVLYALRKTEELVATDPMYHRFIDAMYALAKVHRHGD